MAKFKILSETPYRWAVEVTDKLHCTFVEADELVRLVRFKFNGFYFTLNDSKVLSVIIRELSIKQTEFNSLDELVEYLKMEEVRND